MCYVSGILGNDILHVHRCGKVVSNPQHVGLHVYNGPTGATY